MTPKRKAYLAKCSKRELVLRHWIKVAKGNISRYKFGLNYDKTFTDDDMEYCLSSIRFHKDRINCYRHELARLQGMDRVVVPKVKFSVPQIREWGHTGRKSYYATCKCGNDTLYSGNDERYCPQCGRRILWEKVK